MHRVRRWRGAGNDIALRDLGVGWLIPLWVATAYLALGTLERIVKANELGLDAHAYWLTAHHSAMYGPGPGKLDAYLYSPAFATLMWPITSMSWPAFATIWLGGQLLAFAWLLAPLGRWSVPVFMVCLPTMAQGNIYGLLAVCLVLGLRHPSLWPFALLTKITPGVVLIWFVVRREWRHLAVASGATAAITSVSFLLSADLWTQWIRFLLNNGGESGYVLYVRVVAAGIIAGIAGHRGSPWLLAPAMFLACPVMNGISNLSLLAAIPRLLRVRLADPVVEVENVEMSYTRRPPHVSLTQDR